MTGSTSRPGAISQHASFDFGRVAGCKARLPIYLCFFRAMLRTRRIAHRRLWCGGVKGRLKVHNGSSFLTMLPLGDELARRHCRPRAFGLRVTIGEEHRSDLLRFIAPWPGLRWLRHVGPSMCATRRSSAPSAPRKKWARPLPLPAWKKPQYHLPARPGGIARITPPVFDDSRLPRECDGLAPRRDSPAWSRP